MPSCSIRRNGRCEATGRPARTLHRLLEFSPGRGEFTYNEENPLPHDFIIADDLLAWREYFFDHFTAPDAHFFWCCRRATQLEVDLSGFPNVMAHYKRMQERPSVKELLAYEKEVNERFAQTA